MTDVHPERDTVSIATTIADWCDERAQQLGKDATRQFRLIVGVVLIGLVLLLILPPVIGLIDFSTNKLFGGSPPERGGRRRRACGRATRCTGPKLARASR